MIKFKFNDGGRADAGFKGEAGDCATRALAIASGKPYQEIYDLINHHAKSEKQSKRRRGKSSARTGVHRVTFDKVAAELGFKWIPKMKIGSGCTVHLRADELPQGILIVSLSKHYAAVINGVLHDTYDCSREGTRCVYGYYIKPMNS